MQLILNGQPRAFEGPLSVTALLQLMDIPLLKVAVERNREIVPKSQFDTTTLADGDEIEIVNFVGGG